MIRLNRDEWLDVYRIFLPDATQEQYERDWAEFVDLKRAHKARMAVN
jgi:hypothetical protein